MFRKPCLPGLLISIGLVGCAADQRATGQPVGCNDGGNCKVAVTVNNCVITVDPPVLSVPGTGTPKKIRWDLASSDGEEYYFRGNGIVFKETNTEFDEPELSKDGKRFTWRDKHSIAGDYRYAVNVTRTGVDPKDCTLDPVISNQ